VRRRGSYHNPRLHPRFPVPGTCGWRELCGRDRHKRSAANLLTFVRPVARFLSDRTSLQACSTAQDQTGCARTTSS
jgi:hypothetical protein